MDRQKRGAIALGTVVFALAASGLHVVLAEFAVTWASR